MKLFLQLAFCVGLLWLAACNPPLNKKHLLVLGDSNGVGKGWVYQLQELRDGGPLVNTSLSGNTIGFNYNGSDLSKNTLENLTPYLRKGYAEMGSIDDILIALGTNDCKVEFADQRERVGANLESLLDRTNAFFEERGQPLPRFVILSPPPLKDKDVVEQFTGATACTKELTETYRTIAAERGICFVDFQVSPGASVLQYSKDGIHFDAEGYRLIAQSVLKACY